MSNTRKSLQKLKEEHDEDRKNYGKIFRHIKSGDTYQLLFPAFDEATNEKLAIYVLVAMPWLKFTRPMTEFLEKFEPGHG
jgi:hypothetical protein